ncbi:MAG TPA: hypothetical protein PL124_10130 [Candidatus Cloacimonadota bacterium]|nr:hypothetical protein [Candidatus Cloacimonadota bacterium]HPS39758.1 hypothetical protein [Candidatus Cloacimonadota bacterium]
MNNYAKKFEAQERSLFNTDHWTMLFNQAKAYRMLTGWDQKAEDALRIRKNDLPLRDIAAAPGWKGIFYVDNWLYKGIKWLVSMQTGASLSIDLKGFGGTATPNQDLLEMEMNFANDQFNFQDTVEDCLYERYYPGFGVARGIWNTRDIRPQYLTGTPSLEYISPMNIYFDPATRKRDKSDARHIFHLEYYDLAEMRRRYPKYAHLIPETEDPKRMEATGLTRVLTVQYKKTITVDKVYIQDRESGASQDFLASEWQEYIEMVADDPATVQQYNEENPGVSYEDWIVAGGFLPEKVIMSGPLESEEKAVFQAIYLIESGVILSQPQYVGKDYTYFILIGNHEPDSAYPVGLATQMAGMLELSIITMTVMALQAIKMHKNEKLIQKGALVNEKEYIEKGYQIGMNPIVDEDWQSKHRGVKAVENIPTPDFPTALTVLNQHLVNAQQTFTGAVDVNMGQSPTGDSGVKVAQLQMASRVYQREDLEGLRRFITQIMEWLKNQICQFRNYPHQIEGIDESNASAILNVATDVANRLNGDNYYVEITLQENQEVVKQIEQEIATTMFDKGLMSPLDYLREMDRPNPERQLANAQEASGDRAILEAVQANPEILQYLQQFIQGAIPEKVQSKAQVA